MGHSKSPGLFERFSSERGFVFGKDVDYIRNEITDRGQLEDFVREILSVEMTHIKMDEDGDLHYHRGLHLVIMARA